MQDVLTFILKNLVTVPDDVKIEATDEQGTTNYLVSVNPADVGRIIGKEGKVIKAIRTIMRVIAIQKGLHVRVSVISENDGFAAPADSSAETPAKTEEDNSNTSEESVQTASDNLTVEV